MVSCQWTKPLASKFRVAFSSAQGTYKQYLASLLLRGRGVLVF